MMAHSGGSVWAERDAVFDAAPFDGVPPVTNEAVLHHVVEVVALSDNYRNVMAGWPLVVGRTRCGRRRLEVDRTNTLGRPCKRCFPTHGNDDQQGSDRD